MRPKADIEQEVDKGITSKLWYVVNSFVFFAYRAKRKRNMEAVFMGKNVMGDRFTIVCAVVAVLGATTGSTFQQQSPPTSLTSGQT